MLLLHLHKGCFPLLKNNFKNCLMSFKQNRNKFLLIFTFNNKFRTNVFSSVFAPGLLPPPPKAKIRGYFEIQVIWGNYLCKCLLSPYPTSGLHKKKEFFFFRAKIFYICMNYSAFLINLSDSKQWNRYKKKIKWP